MTTPDTRDLTKGLTISPDDFESYDAFLEAWRSFVAAEIPDTAQLPAKMQPIENMAERQLEKLLALTTPTDHSSNEAFANLAYAAFLCDAQGVVLEANRQALLDFGPTQHMNFADIGIRLAQSGSVQDIWARLNAQHDAGGLELVRAEKVIDGTPFSLAVLGTLNPDNDQARFLIVTLNTPWGAEAQQLVQNRFGLTEAEAEVASLFAAGVSLKQISVQRGRSYTTIRNQFQSVLEKTGCAGQSELLLLLLNLSFLLTHLERTTAPQIATAPRTLHIPRPKGRTMQVDVYGDMDGRPVLSLPSLFGHPITPAIEEMLTARQIKLIGIARPGIGATSPAPEGQSDQACFEGDTLALMAAMEIPICPVLARATAGRMALDLVRAHPDRFSAACLVNALVPGQYVAAEKAQSSWTKALISAARVSPNLAGVILGTGRKLMMRAGTETFIKRMYSKSDRDVAVIEDACVVQAINAGTDYFGRQGLGTAITDMLRGFETWGDDIAGLNSAGISRRSSGCADTAGGARRGRVAELYPCGNDL